MTTNRTITRRQALVTGLSALMFSPSWKMEGFEDSQRVRREESAICRRFGRRLNNAMVSTGLRTADYAKAAGLSVRELVDVFEGHRIDLDIVTADALCDLLGLHFPTMLSTGVTPWD